MGWPVMHSRSPLLHNYFFSQHRLKGTYVPLAIRPEGLGAALRALAPLVDALPVMPTAPMSAVTHGAGRARTVSEF